MVLAAYTALILVCLIIAIYWYLTNKRRPK